MRQRTPLRLLRTHRVFVGMMRALQPLYYGRWPSSGLLIACSHHVHIHDRVHLHHAIAGRRTAHAHEHT
jgi:hypothetical protein